jgi:hypothetical protein
MIHLHNDIGGGSDANHGISACEEEKIVGFGCEWIAGGYLPQVGSLTS